MLRCSMDYAKEIPANSCFYFWEPLVKKRRKRKKILKHLYTKIYGSNNQSTNGSKQVIFKKILQRLHMETFLYNHLFWKFLHLSLDGCNMIRIDDFFLSNARHICQATKRLYNNFTIWIIHKILLYIK